MAVSILETESSKKEWDQQLGAGGVREFTLTTILQNLRCSCELAGERAGMSWMIVSAVNRIMNLK